MVHLSGLFRHSLGTRFSILIGALLLPLFIFMGLMIVTIQSDSFEQLDISVHEAFASIREIDTNAAKNQEESKIEKLGLLMSDIAPAAIASYDFMALHKYATTAAQMRHANYRI